MSAETPALLSHFVGDGFAMLTAAEIAAMMPDCQGVSLAGRRDMDLRTPITPEQGTPLAAAVSEWGGA